MDHESSPPRHIEVTRCIITARCSPLNSSPPPCRSCFVFSDTLEVGGYLRSAGKQGEICPGTAEDIEEVLVRANMPSSSPLLTASPELWSARWPLLRTGAGWLTTWTILQNDGPNHLRMRRNALPGHQMALITSGFGVQVEKFFAGIVCVQVRGPFQYSLCARFFSSHALGGQDGC